jgi:hypothetical protein
MDNFPRKKLLAIHPQPEPKTEPTPPDPGLSMSEPRRDWVKVRRKDDDAG